jgi:hypothetical protein
MLLYSGLKTPLEFYWLRLTSRIIRMRVARRCPWRHGAHPKRARLPAED